RAIRTANHKPQHREKPIGSGVNPPSPVIAKTAMSRVNEVGFGALLTEGREWGRGQGKLKNLRLVFFPPGTESKAHDETQVCDDRTVVMSFSPKMQQVVHCK
ncbi:hypothetical protein BaRGS_00013030, partial [Batillaria attramentaria]